MCVISFGMSNLDTAYNCVKLYKAVASYVSGCVSTGSVILCNSLELCIFLIHVRLYSLNGLCYLCIYKL